MKLHLTIEGIKCHCCTLAFYGVICHVFLDHFDNDMEGGKEGHQGGSALYQVLFQ